MRCLILLIGLIIFTSTSAGEKVVVVPLGSDVTAQQFDNLIDVLNRQRVYSGVVLSNGAPATTGEFTSSKLDTGIYRVRYVPPVIRMDNGDPSFIATPIGLHRTVSVQVSKELIDNQIIYYDFVVELRTSDGVLLDSGFSFMFQLVM